jgi:amidase
MEDAMKTRRCHLKALTRIGSFAVAVALLGLTFERTLLAFNCVVDANGTFWGIQDATSPRVDTGSIRATQIAPGGSNVPFSTQINGFGGIKVLVQAPRPPRFNGELMRGFALTFDGVDRFATTTSVGLAA